MLLDTSHFVACHPTVWEAGIARWVGPVGASVDIWESPLGRASDDSVSSL